MESNELRQIVAEELRKIMGAGVQSVEPIHVVAQSDGMFVVDGKVVLIDPADEKLVRSLKWKISKISDLENAKSYVIATYSQNKGKIKESTTLGRFLLGNPKGMQVRYKNGDTTDCRRTNLYTAERNTDGYKKLSETRHVATIEIGGKKTKRTFKTEAEARAVLSVFGN